jgi:hypothetical protein
MLGQTRNPTGPVPSPLFSKFWPREPDFRPLFGTIRNEYSRGRQCARTEEGPFAPEPATTEDPAGQAADRFWLTWTPPRLTSIPRRLTIR